MGIVYHPVEDRIGQGGVAQRGVPLRDRQLADDRDRGASVALVHQFQNVVAVDGFKRAQAEVVDDDQLYRTESLYHLQGLLISIQN